MEIISQEETAKKILSISYFDLTDVGYFIKFIIPSDIDI